MKPDFKKWVKENKGSPDTVFSYMDEDLEEAVCNRCNQFAEAYAVQKNEEVNELLLDAFMQNCSTDDGYDHMCISTWETAQRYLINVGLIKESECYRK